MQQPENATAIRRRIPRGFALITALLLISLSSCAMLPQWQEASTETVREQDLDGLPYHPLVYHLDLCILSYQLHAQSLIWPFDPYYEELSDQKGQREAHIERVRAWATEQGRRQTGNATGLSSYRGPGLLSGFPDNADHDPIIYRYDRINPRSPALTNALNRWIEYLTPAQVTNNIGKVYVCYRTAGGADNDVTLEHLPVEGVDGNGKDILLVFEGGTGDKGEHGQHASQSLMGFVLIRNQASSPGGKGYDVHIAFRGSRSGSAKRAALQALRTETASGNPDWITDLGYRQLLPVRKEGGSHITTTGTVSRGFATSVTSIFPSISRCLREVGRLKNGKAPDNIYVTGHSLGGALAQHYVSAIMLGNRFGPVGTGPDMPNALRDWPWKNIKLITYGAPRAGDAKWSKALSQYSLQSEPFITLLDPYDRKALPVAHPTIMPRLTNAQRPAAYRVLFSTDPITGGFVGGKHVGRSIYVSEPGILDPLKVWSVNTHEPAEIREGVIGPLQDGRIPPIAWRYRELTEFSPDLDAENRGTAVEYRKLQSALERYHQDNGIAYDRKAFARELELFLAIRQSGPTVPDNGR